MSDGFNNLFNPYRGSLYGRYPTGPVFVSVFLALMDQNGRVDYSLHALAGMTGWPMDLLRDAINDLMQPDPHSRTKAAAGRRLVPIDPSREWGWQVVNAAAYRERARLMAKNARERDSGENAKRMQARARSDVEDDDTAGDRRSPPKTASHTHTTDSKKNPPNPPDGGPVIGHVFGLDVQAWERFVEYRKAIRKPIKQPSIEAAQKKLAAYGKDQSAVVENVIAQGWQGLQPLPRNQPKAPSRSPYAGAV